MLDIFNQDAFSVTSLTDALRDVKPRPSRLNDLGLFQGSGVTTTSIGIERIGDILQLVTPTPRGGPGETRDMPKRSIQSIQVPHFQRDWSVNADEVQGVRAFGSETALETVQGVVASKIQVNMDDLDLTDEYSRIGAIQGIVSYKGGQTLDLFQTFGVSQAAEIDFDLDNTAATDGALLKKCVALIRAVRAAVGGLSFRRVHAFVGDNFFDDLLTNKEVRDTYKGTSEAAFLRDSFVGADRGENPIFQFGGIVWENYGAIESSGDGALMGIPTDKAKFIPLGLGGLFRTYWAPADYVETVNTLGQRTYAKQWPMQNGKGVNGETQRNALHICTRPGALMRGKRT
ncbi:MAG: major capsid protein E [Rhizobiales bacterium 63-7]|nr:major capsid protein [Hyphomicrobiales bacterium]OJU66644.1 MAG: major capsid protein E [Rhizobiales bacterium 63-7]